MKSISRLRRSLSVAGAAALLVGALSVPAMAATISTGSNAVVTATNLNVRQGPGMNYAVGGMLENGYVVKVLETSGGWARIDTGWVDQQFLKPVTPTGAPNYAGQAGYVTANSLNIRQGPGKNYPVCGMLQGGYRVTILQEQNGWGKIDAGWISLDYISASSTNAPSGPSYVTPGSSGSSILSGSRVRVTATNLNVRQGPGTGYTKISSLPSGSVVDLVEIQGNWGRTSQGWICLDYVVSVSAPSAPGQITKGSRVEVTANALRVRSSAGTNYPVNGSLQYGYRTTILDVQGNWGRIDSGWICLDYVRAI